MKKRVTIGLATIAMLVASLFLIPWSKDTTSKFEVFQETYATTVDSFYEAEIVLEVKAGSDIVYQEVTVLDKTESECNYTTTVKELSDDLYGDLYDIETTTGIYTIEETLYFFAPTLNLKTSEVSDYNESSLGTNETKVEFVVLEKNINEGFGFEGDHNIVGKVSFSAELKEDVVISYCYSYVTIDGMNVTIKGTFDK